MKQKGVTLIELIVTMAVFSIFTLAVMNYTTAQLNIYKKVSTQTDLQGSAKLAVDYIAKDIKRCRFTPNSVETVFAASKFTNLTSPINRSYIPIVYIEDMNGSSNYIYVIDSTTNQLLRIDCTAKKFTMDTTKGSTTNVDLTNYDNECTNINVSDMVWNQNIVGSDIFYGVYEKYGNYSLICRHTDPTTLSDVYDSYPLLQESSDVNIGSNKKVIAHNVENLSGTYQVTVTPTDANNKSFNISVTLSKNVVTNGATSTIKRNYSTCASRIGYDGGSN